MLKIFTKNTEEIRRIEGENTEGKKEKLVHPRVAKINERFRNVSPELVVRDKFQPKCGDLKEKFFGNL